MLVAVIVLSVPALTLYVAPTLPMIVAVVTKAGAPRWLKAGLLACLGVVSALVTAAIQNGTSIELDRGFVARLFVSLIGGFGAHFGFLEPLGITGARGKIAQVLPGGLGPAPAPPAPAKRARKR